MTLTRRASGMSHDVRSLLSMESPVSHPRVMSAASAVWDDVITSVLYTPHYSYNKKHI